MNANQLNLARKIKTMKRPFRAKSVADILDSPEGELKALLKKAHHLESFTTSVLQLLPEDLREHCSVSDIDQQTLVLVADSPVWATRLRYHSSQLLADLRQAGHYSIANILIQTTPKVNR